MSNSDTKVISLARQIAKLMHNAANRADALDAHDMARTFFRRMSNPAHPQTSELPQLRKRASPGSV
jgi:hypothetical protein